MADQEIITVSELDVADGASLSAEDQLLVHKAQEGKMQRVAFSGLFSQESASRISNDAALQLQINTMAGIDTDGETPTYRVVEKMDQSLKGVAGGVAELDSEGHVPSSQLPSYVDDVIEGYYKKADGKFYENYTPDSVTHDIWSDGTSFLNSDLTAGTRPAGDAGVEVSLGTVRKYGTDYYQLDTDWYQITELTTSAITLDSTAEDDPVVIAALNAADDLTISYIPYVEDTGTYSDEITPETGKIYVDLRTNLTYRWGSTVYAPLSSDLALGETSATAYRGDRGKVAYEHSQVRGTGTVTADNPHGLSKADIGLGNVPDVTTNNQTPTYEVASDNAELTSGETLSTAFGKIAKVIRSFISHIANTSNPHSVTKAQVGLGDVTNVATTSTITSGDTRNITSGAVYTALSGLDSAKQNKTLDTPLTIDGTSRTTVESALGSLNTSKLRQVTTMPTSPSSGDTVLYLGSETGYLKGTIYQYDGTNWKIISGAGGGGTVAHFSTMSDWETARLITEGNEGFLADDSLVVIDATNFIYIQNGTGSSATLTQIDASVIEYISTLPVSGIKDKLYCVDPTRPHEEELVGFDILTSKNDNVLFKWWTDGHGTQRAMKFPVDLYQNNELLASISEINPSYGYSTDISFSYETSNPDTVGMVSYNSSSNQRIDANTKLVFHDVVRSGEKRLYCGDKENQTVTRFPSKADVMDALAPTVADANKFLTGSGEWKSASISIIIDSIYPVGSIYWTGNQNFDPNVSFGGTWVQIKDRFVLAAGDTYTVNATGGVSTNTLTANNIPQHTHTLDHTHEYTPSGKIASTSNGQEDEKVAGALGTARLTLTDPAGSGAYPQIGFSSNNNTIVEVAMTNRNQGTYFNQYPFNGLNYIDFKLGHSHSAYFRGSQGTTTSPSSSTTSSYGKATPDALNNMPPYIVKFCWERTA